MKKTLIFLMCLCVIVFSLTGCTGKKNSKEKATDIGTNVTVYKVEPGDLETSVNYSGVISAAESVSVISKASAKALSVNVKEGDRVKEGQVLCELDSTDVKLSYEQALAGYNSAVAGYNSIVNSSTKQSSAQAKQTLDAAQIAYDQAKSTYDRELNQYQKGTQVQIAQQQYDDAKKAYEREKKLYETNAGVVAAQSGAETAQNSVQAAENAVSTARSGLDVAQSNYDRVKQLFDIGGASLVELDTAQNSLDNAKANLANAEIALENAKAASQSANASLSTSQTTSSAAMDAAYSQMVAAEKNLDLVKSAADTTLENARAALRNAENSLKTARENIGLTDNANKSSVENAKASVESAKASLNIAKNALDNATLKAPIAGVISKCAAVKGQNVAAGTEAFVIKNTGLVDAEINVTESVIPMISEGSKAVISVASANIHDVEGSVTLVNPVKDDKTGLYSVKVTMSNADGLLNAGMLADVTLTTESLADIVRIPSEALINEGDEFYVYIARKRTAKKVKVKIGIADETYTEIIEGVTIGNSVVVSGKEYLSETNNAIKITGEYKEK